MTQYDISNAMSTVAIYKRKGALKNAHCNVVKRIAKYLQMTKHLNITLGGRSNTSVLTACTNANYGSDTSDRISYSRYVIFYNNGPVSWESRKQSYVATSTTHAKYIALYMVTKEVIWYKRLLHKYKA
jgi:hypothetical protein